jgi:uncharacterized protein involved in exopolysaccharide biosynthesis
LDGPALTPPQIAGIETMFEYGPPAGVSSGGDARPLTPGAGALERARLAMAIARRQKALILGCALACALAGYGASKLITPRYVATTQIYIDPGNLPGADKDALAPGQDSNGFINYVESQSLIITSRNVLERVVADEKLDADPDFTHVSSFPFLTGGPSGAAELSDAAAATLGTRIQVKRPERTFIIDLSVSDRDPIKAAELANATARGYIEVLSSLLSDASRRTEASLAGRLVDLRKRVLEAEKKVEDFKAENGLIGTRDLLVADQQLRDMNAQIIVARTKAAEGRAQLDQIEIDRKGGGGVAAIASQLNSASLTALRTQQAQARQHLADVSGQLGPRHPEVIDARARVAAADAAIDAELARFARSQRIEYDRAKQLEQSLGRQLDALKQQSNENGQSAIGLRDLERQAEAARGVYDLFVTRSRESGEIQQVEPTRTRIISLATAPKSRAWPPSGLVMAIAGLLIGLGLGASGALARERLIAGPAPPTELEPHTGEPDAAPERAAPTFLISRSRLESAQWAQPLERLDLAGLGFPVLPSAADSAEIDAILAALDPVGDARGARTIAVVGANDLGLRTALAINLALCAARRGLRVALIDAAERNAKLTRAVRHATRTPILAGGPLFRTANNILLALPKATDAGIGRIHTDDLHGRILRLRGEAIELIICDGPNASDPGAARILALADQAIVCDEAIGRTDADPILAALYQAGLGASAMVRFEPIEQRQKMRA